LINPWGITSSATSPFWVSDQGAELSTLYAVTSITNSINSLVVTIPAPSTPPSGPTGVVFNSTTGFAIGSTVKLLISFLRRWRARLWLGIRRVAPSSAATVPGAVFTGLAANGNNLYAADFKNNQIDVFNSSFVKTGSFTDPSVPAGYAPYNVHTINGMLYVEYAPVGTNGLPVLGSGNGIVDVFNANGTLVKTLINMNSNLNVPWGLRWRPRVLASLAATFWWEISATARSTRLTL